MIERPAVLRTPRYYGYRAIIVKTLRQSLAKTILKCIAITFVIADPCYHGIADILCSLIVLLTLQRTPWKYSLNLT